MHEVLDHKDRGPNAAIAIEADDPRDYGVSTFYTLRIGSPAGEAPLIVCLPFAEPWSTNPEARGLSDEALLAVLIDRLRGVQLGPLANPYTGRALAYLQRALHAMKQKPSTLPGQPPSPRSIAGEGSPPAGLDRRDR